MCHKEKAISEWKPNTPRRTVEAGDVAFTSLKAMSGLQQVCSLLGIGTRRDLKRVVDFEILNDVMDSRHTNVIYFARSFSVRCNPLS